MTNPTPIRILDRLPEPLRAELAVIKRDAVTLLGELREIQSIVDRNLETLEILIDGGLDYARLVELLAEIGIARPNGRPFPRSTLLRAVSRARQRVSPPEPPQHAAGPCIVLQQNAATRSMLRHAACSRVALQPAAEICDARPQYDAEIERPRAVPHPPATEPPLLATPFSKQPPAALAGKVTMPPASDPSETPADRTMRAASLLIKYGAHDDQ